MAKLIFEGWELGMRKIPFIKLLHEKANFSLSEAKSIKEKIMNDKIITIEISDTILAREILEEIKKLRVNARIGI